MSKKKTVKATKRITEIINKVDLKHKTKRIKKRLKEKITKLKSNNPPLVTTKTENRKKSRNEIGDNNIAFKDNLKTVKRKVIKRLNLESNEETISLVTPKKVKRKKKFTVKNLQDHIAVDEKLLKIEKMKNKSDTRHLIENAETSGYSTPVKKSEKRNTINTETLQKRKHQLETLQEFVSSKSEKKPTLSLRQKMTEKLDAARFRFINEQIYTADGKEAEKLFRNDPSAFQAYHKGFRQQVNRWPLNPLDKIIKMINKMPKSLVIADFGCGEAKLAQSVQQKVHSFDLVAANNLVTACNMARVPLESESVDVAVFCLSLMGTNLKDYLIEANRVLKPGCILKVVEVESRFDNVDDFVKRCKQYGFTKTWMDLSHNLFYFLDFKKTSITKDRKKLPGLSLKPCIYKKR